jgi:hypothetical protein
MCRVCIERDCGQPLPSAALMSPMSRNFVARLESFVARHEIPLVQFRKGERKDAGIAGSPAGKSPSVVKRACEGDMTAARLILERIAPLRRRHPVRLKLPEISDAVSGAARIERLQGAIPEPGQPSDAARESAAVTPPRSSRSIPQTSTRSAAQGGSYSQGLPADFPRES